MNLINWLGVGIVASTKQTNTDEILVDIRVQSPMADGRSVAQTESRQETSLNANGEMETSTTLVSNVVPAKWNSMGETNRLTPPDVREGSKVSCYQVSGQNQIYWTTHGFGAESHRLETIVWGYQAAPTLDQNTPFDINNFYTVTVDTRSGFFAMRTAQANKEKQAMEVRVDGGQGRVDIRGSNNSTFSFDDDGSKFLYTNKYGSLIGVDKKKALFFMPESLSLATEKMINIKTKNLNIEAEEISVKAKKARFDIDDTEWNGNFKYKGLHEHTGNYHQTGNTRTSGIIQGMTDVQTLTVSLNVHAHDGVERGLSTSNVPVPTPIPPVE